MSMSDPSSKPLIGVPVSVTLVARRKVRNHGSAERYLTAVAGGAGAVPMLIPALHAAMDIRDMARRIDGLFLTGGRANIEPHHYGGPPFPEDEIRDPDRDATVLPLIRACLDEGVPVFGVCRGIQELNVALGGTLHYRVHLVEGMLDHRRQRRRTVYANRHAIALTPGGMFERLAGAPEVVVNSLHGQGIDRLGVGLAVEAKAPDGLVEGVRVEGAKTFSVAVQWHAEHDFEDHMLSGALFREFGAAATKRAARRAGRSSGGVRAA
jgi:putative glutamine amidotransferase